MAQELEGCKVAILVAEGFEQSELIEPKKALEAAGAQATIVSPAKGEVQGWKHFEKGEKFKVDVALEQVKPQEFDALLLPGGVANPDQLRMIPEAVQFVRSFLSPVNRWRRSAMAPGFSSKRTRFVGGE